MTFYDKKPYQQNIDKLKSYSPTTAQQLETAQELGNMFRYLLTCWDNGETPKSPMSLVDMESLLDAEGF